MASHQAIRLIQNGKFRALAKLSDRPLNQIPDLPSLAEAAGVPELGDISTWIGFYAPAGTSSEIVGKLQHFIATIYADPAVAKKLDEAGIIPVSSTPGELPPMSAAKPRAGARCSTKAALSLSNGWAQISRSENFAHCVGGGRTRRGDLSGGNLFGDKI